MTNYVKSTNFATKDNLASGDPLKIVKGTEINTEYDNIAIAVATKADVASPTFTGTVTIPTLALTNDLPVTEGGTGASTAANARTNLSAASSGANSDITSITGLTTALAPSQGGTGLATLTANNVVLGNGTSAVQFVAPSTTGNLLTSNGTTWTSAAPPAGGVTSLNGQTGAITNTTFDSIGSYAILVSAQTSDTAVGGTIAGSSLRYSLSTSNGNGGSGGLGFFGYISGVGNSYGGGGTAVSGTWRKMYGMPNWNSVAACCGTNYYFYSALWVRVS
jgi:hypothetical protein